MKRGSEILLLVFTFAISSFTAHAADFTHSNEAEIQHADQAKSSSTYPSSQADLYSVYPQGESGANLLNTRSKTNSENESQDDSLDKLTLKSSFRLYPHSYLMFCVAIEPGLSIKELIFPFHSFL